MRLLLLLQRLELRQLRSNMSQHVVHRTGVLQQVMCTERRHHIPDRERRYTSLVKSQHEGTSLSRLVIAYLNPGNLVFQIANQEAIRHLTASVLHPLKHALFRLLQARRSRAFERTTQHF